MPQPADADHADTCAGLGLGVAVAAHDRVTRAKQRCSHSPVETVRQERATRSPRNHVLRMPAAEIHPGVLIVAVVGFGTLAIITTTAALLHPRHADAVTFVQMGDPTSEGIDSAHWFVAQNPRGLQREGAVPIVCVRSTNPAGIAANTHLARSRLGHSHALEGKGLLYAVEKSSVHVQRLLFW